MNYAPLYLSIAKGGVMAIIAELGFLKVCVCWVPWMLKDAHEKARKKIATDVFGIVTLEVSFLLLIVMVGFKTWIPHFEFGSKQ